MKKQFIKNFKLYRPASALIMTIVLTVLLAIVAVMFLAVARMDRASTSNIADNKTLDLAAKSLVEIISKELINDTPGVAGQEYYDYPDANNAWLASIESYQQNISDPNTYKWRQISDVTGYLKDRTFSVRDVNVDPEFPLGPPKQDVIREYPDITLTGGNLGEQLADADGDGIADSKWIELKGVAGSNWSMRSSKGKAIYAAIRIIDNGGMVNINTAHTFNPDSTSDANINGASQMQINLKGLLKGTPAEINKQIKDCNLARCGGGSGYWPNYEKNVIWDYNTVPGGGYLPFDISDELELRYRYCIDSKFRSRIEDNLEGTVQLSAMQDHANLYDGSSNWGLHDWQERITEPNDPKADRRHMLTTYNYDRIIDPNGDRMTNINTDGVKDVNSAIRRGLYDAGMNHSEANGIAAQIAVNIIDYRDTDPTVTVLNVDGKDYYGFETPCVYISELAYKQVTDGNTNIKYKSYAIELFKPYPDDIGPNSTWQVRISNPSMTIPINSWTGTKSYYVIKWEQLPQAVLTMDTSDANSQSEPFDDVLTLGSTISLTRNVNGTEIVVDSNTVSVDWSSVIDGNHCIRRDIRPNQCMRRLWDPSDSTLLTLGRDNVYSYPEMLSTTFRIQAHPANSDFTNIGQIGMVFRKPAYYELAGGSNTGVIGYGGINQSEPEIRLDVNDPNYQGLFKYLTVWPRPGYALGLNETIKGRININTAPAYVIAQLPWVSYRPSDYNDPNIAKAIVAYRDKMAITDGPDYYQSGASNSRQLETGKNNISEANGFGSIGELMNVINNGLPAIKKDYDIRHYSLDGIDQQGFPDLNNDPPSSGDGAANDFEERDLIFARISDLVTVRSDVFTAYILVRVGAEGPQKRYMVIFDRSKTTSANKRVKIIAFQVVPEAR